MKIEKIAPPPPQPAFVLTLSHGEMETLLVSLRGNNPTHSSARIALAVQVEAAFNL